MVEEVRDDAERDDRAPGCGHGEGDGLQLVMQGHRQADAHAHGGADRAGGQPGQGRVARGTVQARLDRMQQRGVITGYGPEVDPAALGYPVTAFVTLEIRQAGGHDPVADRLAAIPEVLEVHTITGAGDMLCRVVARTNADLQRVLDAIVSTEGVVRSSTLISLATQVPYRVLPLVCAAASGTGPQRSLWPACGSGANRGVLVLATPEPPFCLTRTGRVC